VYERLYGRAEASLAERGGGEKAAGCCLLSAAAGRHAWLPARNVHKLMVCPAAWCVDGGKGVNIIQGTW
jgi:hypothetical protein